MRCLLRMRLAGGLIVVARAMRVLRRYDVSRPRVSMAREGSLEVATVSAMLPDSRQSVDLTNALARMHGLLEAVVSRDEWPVIAFYVQPRSSPVTPVRSTHEWRHAK